MEKDKRIVDLKKRLDDLRQYTRMNDVVGTGLKIVPRSYAYAVTADSGGEPDQLEVSSAERQVAAFLGSRGIVLDRDNILSPGGRPTMYQP